MGVRTSVKTFDWHKLMFVLHRVFNKITDRVPRDRRF